jgi:hypothetical protein
MNSPSGKVERIRSGVAAALLFGLVSAFAFPAVAAPAYYKFYDGGTGYTGPYSGGSTVYGLTKLLPTSCPIGSPGCGAADIFGIPNSLTFAGGAGMLTATATAGLPGSSGQRVWDDIAPDFGGLGVDSIGVGDSSEDQISGSEVLKLSFANQVTLTGVATLFVSDHAGFGNSFPTAASVAASASTINFEISTDGTSWSNVLFANANNNALSITSNTFYFRQDVDVGTSNPSFYVGAVAVTPVPEPETYAMLLAGLGLLGFAARRRKLKAVAAA